MTNRTAWVAGNGVGLTWTACFAPGDLTSLVDSKSVLSSAAAITNGTNLDIYADVSVEITVGSATPRAGAYIGIWLAPLQNDGTIYGDGQLVAGTAATYVPPWSPAAIIPIQSTNASTTIIGQANGIILPPGSFNFILYNFTNVTLSSTAANNTCKFRTYNINLNN